MDVKWTERQREAIQTVDRSVLVSAAAGSGKTAVLAERCAHLVCDAPSPFRCDVDRLLVVTFTEAAAAEMRSRIKQALEKRCAASPDDRRLRTQAALVDTAQISTLHSFCLWMVRRWFSQAGVDATAQLLNEDESRLLRVETLRVLFDELYADDHAQASAFRDLVADYGLGNDWTIAGFVLQVAEFANSLPDPAEWLARAADDSNNRIESLILAHRQALEQELARQSDDCRRVVQYIQDEFPIGGFYGHKIEEYAEKLSEWRETLAARGSIDAVRAEIKEFELSSRGSPRFSKDEDPAILAQRDAARSLFDDARRNQKLLQERWCLFNNDELAAGIRRVLPYAATLADLARAFQRRYDDAKQAIGMMDFADLERRAYQLLTHPSDTNGPNPIAAELQRRFEHVLVDEYQDINPLQAALLAAVSREGQPGSPGNLFTVGDVKQSIYRFRLAEPLMFLDRQSRFRDPASTQACIDLQENFRSNATILAAANLVFSRLMQPETGGIDYDERAALKHFDPSADPGPPVELHILERDSRKQTDDAGKTDDQRYVDLSDPLQWRPLEREAHLVGQRIRDLIDSGMTVRTSAGDVPLAYSHICVLLRSPRHSAAPLADMLEALGIPAWCESAGSLFETREVRDTLALLAIIDNLQQDIPLAAVLRSGMIAPALTEDQLVETRAFDRKLPFHAAVLAYADRGPDATLRDRLNLILRRVQRYRDQVRVQPVADVLWSIYVQTGYLAYVGGLRDGQRRRANLVALHERARQFGTFRRQGLRRFLKFLDSLKDEDQDFGAPSPLGPAENVVRIMSIHKAKGLEFPVVIAAELGRSFNLSDSTGRFLYDRELGIGLKAVERDRLIEYPTGLHRLCSLSNEQASRAEELRVWYVALTRPRQKLILVGTSTLDSIECKFAMGRVDSDRVSPRQVMTANCPLQWMALALGGADAASQKALFQIETHSLDQISQWTLPDADDAADDEFRKAVAQLQPLPESEARGNLAAADAILDGLDLVYPHLAVSSVRAALTASEAKRRYGDALATEFDRAIPPALGADRETAARRGTATHLALQLMDLSQAADAGAIRRQIDQFVKQGALEQADADLVDADSIAWFFSTDLGRRVCAARRYLREWMFLAAETVAFFDPAAASDPDDRVLVRGVADGIIFDDQSLEVIDFKTDAIDIAQTKQRAKDYRMQMKLYANAVSRAFNQPVTAMRLIFLHPRQIVDITDPVS